MQKEPVGFNSAEHKEAVKWLGYWNRSDESSWVPASCTTSVKDRRRGAQPARTRTEHRPPYLPAQGCQRGSSGTARLRAPGTWRAAGPRGSATDQRFKSKAPPGAERPTTPGTSATAASPPPPPAHLRSAAPGEARRRSAVPYRPPPPPGPQPPPPPGDRPAPPASRPPPPSLPASLSARRCRPRRGWYRWCAERACSTCPSPGSPFPSPLRALGPRRRWA